MSIENKTVIVTGAASGIGAATTRKLAELGARVVAVDIAEGPLREFVAEIKSAGYEISGQPADVTDFGAMEKIVTDLRSEGRDLDAIVGIAGLSDISSVSSGDPARWRDVLLVNALGPMVAARAALPVMIDQGYGDIIVVTSASGRITYVGEPAYVASKHAAVAFLESLRKELADSDIRVTSIEPGLVDTPMTRQHPFMETIFSSVEALRPSDIAELIEYCLALPRRMTINEVVLRPTRQEL